MQMSSIAYLNEKGSLIEKWLNERQKLIVAFSNLCQIRPYQDSNTLLSTCLEEFCEILVDYLCRCHFEMYTSLLQEIENCQRSPLRIHPSLLEKLLLSTEKARDFDKAYETPEHYDNLDHDLSLLGENLAHRFEWEDELIHAYLEATAWHEEPKPAKSA